MAISGVVRYVSFLMGGGIFLIVAEKVRETNASGVNER